MAKAGREAFKRFTADKEKGEKSEKGACSGKSGCAVKGKKCPTCGATK